MFVCLCVCLFVVVVGGGGGGCRRRRRRRRVRRRRRRRCLVAKNRQIGWVFTLFETPRAQNTVNTNAFCASQAQNHGITTLFAFGSKHHGIHFPFWPAPGKNTGIYKLFT